MDINIFIVVGCVDKTIKDGKKFNIDKWIKPQPTIKLFFNFDWGNVLLFVKRLTNCCNVTWIEVFQSKRLI